jgi:hypothetical protein
MTHELEKRLGFGSFTYRSILTHIKGNLLHTQGNNNWRVLFLTHDKCQAVRQQGGKKQQTDIATRNKMKERNYSQLSGRCNIQVHLYHQDRAQAFFSFGIYQHALLHLRPVETLQRFRHLLHPGDYRTGIIIQTKI